MSNKLNRIYIGAICNRDLEVFEQIKKFLSKNYNISIVNLYREGTEASISKYIKKKLKKYPISLIIIKLLSEDSNQVIYDSLEKVAPKIPLLNSIKSVKTCESRRETFRLIEQKCKNLKFPQSFQSTYEAYKACSNGKKIIIKLDTHNIPNLPRNDRIIGVAKNSEQFRSIIKEHKDSPLFFQEYLGKPDIIYKIYVIDRWVVSVTSHNRLQENENLSPLDLIHIRVPIEKHLKRRILRLGRAFRMPIFGIDYIISKDGEPYVIDVNDFPSFRSIPEAVSLISDYIYNIIATRPELLKVPAKVKG
ncbi:MAG: RimK family alpha-L-glutamate ligase [Candidatus Hodarchaeota archaeon]